MISIDVSRFTIFSVAFSQLVVALGFAPVTRASSVMPLGNEYAIEFHPPLDRGAPDNAIGECTRCGSKFTPLIPADLNRDDTCSPPFGLTVSANPTFVWLFHRQDLRDIYFSIYEGDIQGEMQDDSPIYSVEFKVPERKGFVSIGLPSDALEIGKTYRWYVEFLSDEEFRHSSGWIERVEISPTLSSQLASAETPLDRARVYAEAGIWHDAIEILVQERRLGDTPELEEEWKEFLMSADFTEYVTEIPLLDCCSDRVTEPR